MTVSITHGIHPCAVCKKPFLRNWPKNVRCPACVAANPGWRKSEFKKRSKEAKTC